MGGVGWISIVYTQENIYEILLVSYSYTMVIFLGKEKKKKIKNNGMEPGRFETPLLMPSQRTPSPQHEQCHHQQHHQHHQHEQTNSQGAIREKRNKYF